MFGGERRSSICTLCKEKGCGRNAVCWGMRRGRLGLWGLETKSARSRIWLGSSGGFR